MLDPISQTEAITASPLREGEAARFFVAERLEGLDCLRATYVHHTYAPHTHDTYVIGTILEGCETWTLRGERHYGGPGDIVFVNPHEVHDGAPHGGGYSYRTTYPSVAVIGRIARSVAGDERIPAPHFPLASVRDPAGAALLASAHRAAERSDDPFGAEEALHRAYAALILRHGGVTAGRVGDEPRAVGRVRQLIEADPAADLALDRLAAEAGLSVHHLIRAFRRATGLTPHAYLVDVRIRHARAALRGGAAPADVAAALGFADQAHLTRQFKARVGVGPGAYRRAAAA
jgi:AraC-like DNA-binding protein